MAMPNNNNNNNNKMSARQTILIGASIAFNVLWVSLYAVVHWQQQQQQQESMQQVVAEAINTRDLFESSFGEAHHEIQARRLGASSDRRRLLEKTLDARTESDLEEAAGSIDDDDKPNSVEPLQRTDDNPFGMPLEYVEISTTTTNHGAATNTASSTSYGQCLGTNFQKKTSWYYTSCHVHLMCYDTVEEDYVIMDNPTEAALRDAVLKQHDSDSFPFDKTMYTSAANLGVPWSMGVINPQWAPDDWTRLRRSFRRVPPQSYYALPDNVVLVPFHSMAGFNPGHLIWDDLFPLWTLLDVFDLWKQNKHMLYIREGMNPGIWATCDDSDALHRRCEKTMPKFFPLMGSSHTLLFDKPSVEDIFGKDENENKDKVDASNTPSRLICAKEGVVGLGMMSDHGMKQHGWWIADYEWNHNVGRGPQLWQFRNFMMENLLGKAEAAALQRRRRGGKHLLLFSQKSSARPFDIAPFAEFVMERFQNDDEVEVQRVVFAEMSLEEQVKLTAQASMLFSISGGGTVTGMFLPRGASLVLWYESDAQDGGGLVPEPNNIPKNACRLDFDLWNNAGYIRTHWLPYTGEMWKPSFPPGPIVENLIRHELDIMAKQGY